jgi:hypothetical protein
MSSRYSFDLQIPINGKRLKYTVFSMIVTFILCIAGIILSSIYYDDYTEVVTTLSGKERVIGWPATAGGWSKWLAIAIAISLPMMIFMQDWRNPSLGLTPQGLFINQQMIRNTMVPFDNIATIKEESKNGNSSFEITFRDPAKVVAKQIFLFRPFVKSNLTNKNSEISGIHSKGDLAVFFTEMKRRTGLA